MFGVAKTLKLGIVPKPGSPRLAQNEKEGVAVTTSKLHIKDILDSLLIFVSLGCVGAVVLKSHRNKQQSPGPSSHTHSIDGLDASESSFNTSTSSSLGADSPVSAIWIGGQNGLGQPRKRGTILWVYSVFRGKTCY